MSNANDAASRSLVIKKTFDAPVRLVWEAWTQPDHLAQWWAPKGMQTKIIAHDFKVGGKWKYTMPMPDGTEFVSEGEYLEIVTHQKIVTTADFKPMTAGVEIHVLFEDNNGNTDFTFTVIHPTEEYCKQQEKMGFYNGWGSTLGRLAAFVTNLQAVK